MSPVINIQNSGASTPFDPLSIAWGVYLDAESISGNDGDLIAAIVNQGSEADFSAGGDATTRPTLRGTAGNKHIEFDGTSDWLVADSLIPAWATWTCYIVAKDGNGDARYFMAVGAGGVVAILRGFTAGKWEYFQTPRTVIADVNTGAFQVIKNTAGFTENFLWVIGAQSFAGTFWLGDVKLIAAIEGALTAGEASNFENYLATKL